MSRYSDAEKIKIPLLEMEPNDTWMIIAINAASKAKARATVLGEWVQNNLETIEKCLEGMNCSKCEYAKEGKPLMTCRAFMDDLHEQLKEQLTEKGEKMFVVYKVLLDKTSVKFERLQEFETLDDANEFMAKQKPTETESYTIMME